jgi:hypothetical protein
MTIWHPKEHRPPKHQRLSPESAFHVDAHDRPHVGPSTSDPSAIFPSGTTDFTRPGYCVKRPNEFPGASVERANITTRTLRRVFGNLGTNNHKIFVDCGRRSEDHPGPVVCNAGAQVHATSRAEVTAGVAGSRIKCNQSRDYPSFERAKQNSAVTPIGGLPITDSAMCVEDPHPGGPRLRIETPNLLPGLRIKRDDSPGRRGEIHHPVHHEGRRFKWLYAFGIEIIRPGRNFSGMVDPR